MGKRIKENTVCSALLIFAALLAVHTLEVMCLRLDESFFAENFLNKLFGIGVIFCVLRWLKLRWSDIGFSAKGLVKSVLLGFSLAVCTFAVAYAVEVTLLKGQGHSVKLGVFSVAYSLVGEGESNTGIGYILMCVFFNVINVVTEEGVFRGLLARLVSLDRSERTAILLQSLLFGVWHIVTPFRDLADGNLKLSEFAVLGIGYIILAGLMGIKWSLLYRMTGSLYAGMADHFFNNCIATNLLHIVTENGIDEMMTLRIIIAQILSFAAVSAVFCRQRRLKTTKEKSDVG